MVTAFRRVVLKFPIISHINKWQVELSRQQATLVQRQAALEQQQTGLEQQQSRSDATPGYPGATAAVSSRPGWSSSRL